MYWPQFPRNLSGGEWQLESFVFICLLHLNEQLQTEMCQAKLAFMEEERSCMIVLTFADDITLL